MFHLMIWYRDTLQKILVIWGPLLFAGGWALAFILGFYGYYTGYHQIHEERPFSDILYTTLQLFLINYKLSISPPNIYLHIARFLAPTMMFLTAILLLLSRFQDCVRELYIRTRRDHAVICGIGILGPSAVRKFIELNIPVLALESDATSGEIEKCRDAGAVVLSGDANDEITLRRLNITQAAYCLIATGDDARNIGIGSTIEQILSTRNRSPLTCYVHITDHHMERLLTSGQISDRRTGVVFDYFSLYRKAGEEAVRMWLDLSGGSPDPNRPVILVAGVGRMGENLVLRLAREWCGVYQNTGIMLTILLLDRRPGIKDHILAKHPWMGKHCMFEEISTDLTGGAFLSGALWSPYFSRLSAIFLCVNDETTGMSAALSIRQNCDSQDLLPSRSLESLPVFVRIEREDGTRRFLATIGDHPKSRVRIYPFPVLFRNHSLFTLIGGPRERVAQVIHEEYRADHPEVAGWDDLAENLKNSNRDLADTISTTLHGCGYKVLPRRDCSQTPGISAADLQVLAAHEHNRYVRERLKAGWRFGPKKDTAGKIHDALVPWDELDEQYRMVTMAMVENYPRYLAAAGLGAVKEE